MYIRNILISALTLGAILSPVFVFADDGLFPVKDPKECTFSSSGNTDSSEKSISDPSLFSFPSGSSSSNGSSSKDNSKSWGSSDKTQKKSFEDSIKDFSTKQSEMEIPDFDEMFSGEYEKFKNQDRSIDFEGLMDSTMELPDLGEGETEFPDIDSLDIDMDNETFKKFQESMGNMFDKFSSKKDGDKTFDFDELQGQLADPDSSKMGDFIKKNFPDSDSKDSVSLDNSSLFSLKSEKDVNDKYDSLFSDMKSNGYGSDPEVLKPSLSSDALGSAQEVFSSSFGDLDLGSFSK